MTLNLNHLLRPTVGCTIIEGGNKLDLSLPTLALVILDAPSEYRLILNGWVTETVSHGGTLLMKDVLRETGEGGIVSNVGIGALKLLLPPYYQRRAVDFARYDSIEIKWLNPEVIDMEKKVLVKQVIALCN